MDQVQPSTSCLPRTSGARRALHELLGSRTPRATKMLAQCLFHAKRLVPPKSDGPWVIVESGGSGALCARISYSHADTVDCVLKKLTLRLLGRLGETFVAYDLCKKPMPDQSADKLYEALAPTTCLSSMMQADETGKSPPLCLQLIIKRHQTDEDKVNFINEALRQATTDEQLLRILEIIGQINNQSLRRSTLRDNIQYFLTRPYLKIAEQITNIAWRDRFLYTIGDHFLGKNDLEKMHESILLIASPWQKSSLLEITVKQFLERNDLKKAREIVEQINVVHWKDETLRAIAKKFLKRNDPKKALEVARLITKSTVRSSAMWDIYKPYIMNAISKIVKVVCFAILSLITYKLITSIRNASLLQKLSAKTKA